MNLEFTKMQGAGNDYIYFNCLEREINEPEALAIKLTDRHFSIGGDGIVLICSSEVADAKMRMFNIDGSEGKMCGNAIRCVGKYIYDNKITRKTSLTIDTLSGIKKLELYIIDNLVHSVRVDMGKAEFIPSEIPVLLDGDKIINREIRLDDKKYSITCISMGNPHCILFLEDIETIAIESLGTKFENAPIFPERINTEFVTVIDRNTIKMRVWERGSGETLACGTGACAAAVAAVENGFCNKGEEIRVILRGGDLYIYYTEDAVYMKGSAEKAFEGVVAI